MAPAIANGQYDYTVAASVPVTKSKHIPRDLDKEIQNPGVARATRAVSKESPEGTQSYQNDTRTVLQQHVVRLLFVSQFDCCALTSWKDRG